MSDSTPDAAPGVRDDGAVEAALRARTAHRPVRDDAAQAAALAALAQCIADTPEDALHCLAEVVRDLCGAASVVIAVRDAPPDDAPSDGPDEAGSLRWCAVSGSLAAREGARWPLDACPCGVTMQAGKAMLFEHPAERFSSVRAPDASPAEVLGVPWRVRGGAAGALAVMLGEDSGIRFDGADLRLLRQCAAYAAAAHQAGGGLERKVESKVEERLRPVLESKEHLEREVEATRASERALRAYKALIEATLSISTVGVLYFDIDGTVRDVNAAFERMTGYTRADLDAMANWRDMTPPEFRDVSARALRDLVATGVTLPYTKQMVRKDGSRWWGLFAPARIGGEGEGEAGRCVLFVLDVTENKETEARLAESEERFRAMVEGFAQAVWETDAHGRVLAGSPSWTAYTGQREAQSLGVGWIDAVHPDDRAHVLREWRAALGTRRMLNTEFRVHTAAGGWRWTNARAAPLFNHDGSVRKWVGMHIDVDERHRTQAALAESERRYRMLFEAMDEGFLLATVRFDAQGRATGLDYADANPAAVRMADIAYVGPGVLRMRPEHEPCWLDACAQVVRTGVSSRSQCFAPAPSRWYDFFVYPVGDRQVPRVAILFHDITVRKRAEDALRESEGRFRALADASPALVYQFDTDGNVIYLNQRCVTAPEQGDDAGADGPRGWHGIARPRDIDAYLRTVFEGIRARGAFNQRVHAMLGDGSWHWFESHASPWHSGEGEHRGYVGISLDITGAVQSEEALKDADRRKDEFLATLAHELRNPLAPISNAVQLLRRPDGRRQADRVIEMVGRQVRQIVRLVDDLMEVSRITRGKIDLKLERLPFADVVQGAVETSQPMIERAGHRLAVALPDEPLCLEADRVRLTQVFANLLNNAAKYTDTGGHIWFEARRDGDTLVATVRDTGIGIPPEALPRVFDMFAQAHSIGRGQGGLGIGLTMVRSLVEMHHGSVEARSAGPGQGSEFVVRLPLAAERAPAAATVPAGQARPSAPLHGQRILVVDDNRDAADTLGLLLEGDGAAVRVVYDGRAALAQAETFQPTSVLLDLGMPGMDGYEVARRLRQDERFSGVRIVALTGWGQDADRRQTRNRGFSHHLTKPVSLEDLHAILT